MEVAYLTRIWPHLPALYLLHVVALWNVLVAFGMCLPTYGISWMWMFICLARQFPSVGWCIDGWLACFQVLSEWSPFGVKSLRSEQAPHVSTLGRPDCDTRPSIPAKRKLVCLTLTIVRKSYSRKTCIARIKDKNNNRKCVWSQKIWTKCSWTLTLLNLALSELDSMGLTNVINPAFASQQKWIGWTTNITEVRSWPYCIVLSFR